MTTDMVHKPTEEIAVQDYFSSGKHHEAAAITRKMMDTLVQRGLENTLERVVTLVRDTNGQELLICPHNLRAMSKLELYKSPEVLHHLSTAIGGRAVEYVNDRGLWYCVVMSKPRPLPTLVDFPGAQRGQVLLGQGYSGQGVRTTWGKLGHMLVGGMTGSGKSHFLRMLVYQAVREGVELLLADRDGTTFPMLAQLPQLQAPIARVPVDVLALVEKGLAECDHRAALYAQLGTFPDNLEEYNADALKMGLPILPRILVILDEFNATVTEAGGPKSPLANAVSELGWRGRKFGMNLVFAAQDFTKDIVGRVRDQVNLVICFRVRNADIARVVGCPDAAKMTRTRPGLAYTDRWQYMQAYYLPKSELIAVGRTTPAPVLSATEQTIVQRALGETEGRLSIPQLVDWGMMKEWGARKLLDEWELRGWVRRDTEQKNSRVITPKMRVLFSNTQTPQTPSNSSNTPPADGARLKLVSNTQI